jgi:hypothetical protein
MGVQLWPWNKQQSSHWKSPSLSQLWKHTKCTANQSDDNLFLHFWEILARYGPLPYFNFLKLSKPWNETIWCTETIEDNATEYLFIRGLHLFGFPIGHRINWQTYIKKTFCFYFSIFTTCYDHHGHHQATQKLLTYMHVYKYICYKNKFIIMW